MATREGRPCNCATGVRPSIADRKTATLSAAITLAATLGSCAESLECQEHAGECSMVTYLLDGCISKYNIQLPVEVQETEHPPL